jgi:hypothetical protein
MTKKQEKDIITSIKEYSKAVLSSKENSQKFLVELGVNHKNGKLTSNYK